MKTNYISVDVETSGPVPGMYDLLSIGACCANEPGKSFYIELKPVSGNALPESLSISGLVMEKLAREGIDPAEAMRLFEQWLCALSDEEHLPVFVAFNAGFDWMFVSFYFARYLGRNPFGFAPLDIKALYMGVYNTRWEETKMSRVSRLIGGGKLLSHHALQDALDQAEIFRKILAEMEARENNYADGG